MAKPFANSGGPDQTPRSAASNLFLHCLPINHLGVPDYNWLNCNDSNIDDLFTVADLDSFLRP